MGAYETIFTMDTSSIKYGTGSTSEVGFDLARFDCKRVAVITDPNLTDLEMVQMVMAALSGQSMEAVKFDRVRIEPTDKSFQEAIDFAVDGQFDGYVAIGGGSTIDTAKIANLYATHPTGEFLDYVNAPIGGGKPIPGPVKPLIAIPTTAGTGSETTGVAVFDVLDLEVKTGISHRYLRPVMGIIDPLNTATMPSLVAASSGLDVLSHAVESLTAIPYDKKPAASNPTTRPPYQGSNPISDIWSSKAIEIVGKYMMRVMNDASDIEARGQMMLAASFAGIGFGNAGVHLPHAMSYPVAGKVPEYRPDEYNVDYPLVPHGIAVILNAPAVFRWTAEADPERHLYAAKLLGADTAGASPEDAGELLANATIQIMRDTGMPNGLSAVGFTEEDASVLADGALKQQRLTKLSPRQATRDDLIAMFKDAMVYW